MGFSIKYRSTQSVSAVQRDAIQQAARAANTGRAWLSCAPVHFHPADEGPLIGSTKPNLMPHPTDVAAAAREGLPDGTTRDMLDILCHLSRDHGVDWEISHDGSGGPVGYIRNGMCDEEVSALVEAFGDLGDILGELGMG